MATLKHISSKNADYSAAESHLTFEHEDFSIACLRANLRYGKNLKREDVKSHHYIISFDP